MRTALFALAAYLMCCAGLHAALSLPKETLGADLSIVAVEDAGKDGFISSFALEDTSESPRPRRSMGLHTQATALVPEPSTYLAGALVGLPLLVGGVRKWRQNRAMKA